jgi:DNA (cytosine-5)-methyltransferase 1
VRHASFFSGVGGLDLGFERAGIKTVSVCEIDPYASSVLAERFPEAPNLGDIVKLAERELGESNGTESIRASQFNGRKLDGKVRQTDQQSEGKCEQELSGDDSWRSADIWSGGFPCQDLSVAGKRAGFAGKRSSLAFTFLDLVERYRPRWIVLENVPGLFSSNNGADFGRLLYEMEQIGYSVAWRTLDARYFGVPQRRRRVFIVASLEPDRAAEVLFECEGCERHPAPSWTQRQGVTSNPSIGTGGNRFGAVAGQSGATTDADGMRTADGMARRLDDQQVVAYQTRVDEKAGNFTINQVEVANSLSALWPADTSHRSMTLVSTAEDIISFPSAYSRQPTKFNNVADPLTLSAGAPAVFRKSSRAQTNEDSETWVEGDVANTINSFDVGDIRTTHAIVGATGDDDELLPDKLDGHRYRCCGNGVVAPVAEWIGNRIIAADAGYQHDKMLRAMDDAADFAEDHEVPYRDD